MVRLYNKTKIASAVTLAVAAPVAILASQRSTVSAADVNFNVDIPEVITMSIAEPTTWASGSLTYNSTSGKYESSLLKNKVTVSAQTNNAVGVTVSMYTNNTNLVNQANSSYTIPTLDGSYAESSFPVNAWGYSKNGTDYSPLSTTAIGVLATATGTSASQDVYFGARANNDKQSGTYAQTVYFTAVTGTVDTSTNPTVPSTPTPAPANPTDNNAVYDSTVGSTTGTVTGSTRRTTRTTDGSGTSSTTGEQKVTTTQVSAGNTTSSYTQAQGVTTSTSSVDGGASVATALGIAAAVAATSGTVFFLLAKRKKDEDEEEQ